VNASEAKNTLPKWDK